jgi:3-oxoacyl-[acyl-carrier-protein] synthase-1
VSEPLAILQTGFVTSVGLSAPASCAAIRAKVTNPTATKFLDAGGEWIMAHQVPLQEAARGLRRLTQMAALAIEECLADVPREDWRKIALLLCVAERDRPGRLAGLDEQLFGAVQDHFGVEFASQSLIVPQGRASLVYALMHARDVIAKGLVSSAVIVAADSLLTAATLKVYERNDRLLTIKNSNGFMPGEGAAAVLVGATASGPQLFCSGIGVAQEPATPESGEPLRGEGLARAIKAALADAGVEMHHMDFRICDVSGEHYYFKEAALALSRVLRVRKEEFDIWHPAECIGESGAVAGLANVIVAHAACTKHYAKGPNILCHVASDNGDRGALVLQFRS